MTQEKKKIRFTCVDAFIIILILVVSAAFFAKGYLANLIRNEQELVEITYTLSFDREPMGLTSGTDLSTSSGRSLGKAISLRQSAQGEQVRFYCDAEGYAGTSADGFVISEDTVLRQGDTLVVCWGEEELLAKIEEISAK